MAGWTVLTKWEVDVIFFWLAESLGELLDQVKSFKAVLLNMFRPDREVPRHLTFEDNRMCLAGVCFFFFFPNREHSASLMMDTELLVMCKERDNRSREVTGTQAWWQRGADCQSHSRVDKAWLYYLDCLLDIWFLFDVIPTSFSRSWLIRNEMLPNIVFSASVTASALWCEVAEVAIIEVGNFWHPLFSSDTACHPRTAVTSRLVSKPSGKLTLTACIKCQ